MPVDQHYLKNSYEPKWQLLLQFYRAIQQNKLDKKITFIF